MSEIEDLIMSRGGEGEVECPSGVEKIHLIRKDQVQARTKIYNQQFSCIQIRSSHCYFLTIVAMI